MIELRGVSHAFGDDWTLRNISFTVEKGKTLAVVGASGSGKSTVLNFISGLLRPTEGEVLVDGQAVAGLQPWRIGYMFARDGLLPWRTARRNVELGLEFQGMPAEERRAVSDRLLGMVGLSNVGDKYRTALSQGMRQRVALARTLATNPDILLMDEPFAALDAQTRLALSERFLRLCEDEHYTVVWVTHDLAEAAYLADEVVVLGGKPTGVIARHDVPFSRPRDLVQLGTTPEFQSLVSSLWGDIGDPSLS